jgi:hypothetical protein
MQRTGNWPCQIGLTRVLQAAYPSKNENPLLPHPEPSVTVRKTHEALRLFGVSTRSAMQMQIDAMTIHT